jgi:hypothetical protein
MLAAMALTLTLQLAPAADGPAQTTHLPQTVFAEAPAKPRMRSWGWTAAGAYGFSTFGAGIAGIVAYHTDTTNRSKVNLAMGLGAIAGLIPGFLIGNEARKEENEKTRAYIPIVDVLGTMTAISGYVITH